MPLNALKRQLDALAQDKSDENQRKLSHTLLVWLFASPLSKMPRWSAVLRWSCSAAPLRDPACAGLFFSSAGLFLLHALVIAPCLPQSRREGRLRQKTRARMPQGRRSHSDPYPMYPPFPSRRPFRSSVARSHPAVRCSLPQWNRSCKSRHEFPVSTCDSPQGV